MESTPFTQRGRKGRTALCGGRTSPKAWMRRADGPAQEAGCRASLRRSTFQPGRAGSRGRRRAARVRHSQGKQRTAVVCAPRPKAHMSGDARHARAVAQSCLARPRRRLTSATSRTPSPGFRQWRWSTGRSRRSGMPNAPCGCAAAVPPHLAPVAAFGSLGLRCRREAEGRPRLAKASRVTGSDPPTGDGGVGRMSPLKHEVERMLSERRPFGAIEDCIDRMPCTDDVKAALWLFAWNRQYARACATGRSTTPSPLPPVPGARAPASAWATITGRRALPLPKSRSELARSRRSISRKSESATLREAVSSLNPHVSDGRG